METKVKSKFQVAWIVARTHKTKGYKYKEYITLSGFKKGLKANHCPFDVDDDGYFYDLGGIMSSRQWNYAGQQFTAAVEIYND